MTERERSRREKKYGGEWAKEPENEIVAYYGFICEIERTYSLCLQGKILIPKGHRWFGISPISMNSFVKLDIFNEDYTGGENHLGDWILAFKCDSKDDIEPEGWNSDKNNTATYKNMEYVKGKLKTIAKAAHKYATPNQQRKMVKNSDARLAKYLLMSRPK